MKSLMAQANWVVWRKDSERGKVPVNPYTGGNAMSNNPSTWSDYPTAQATARQYDGIGLMFYEGIGGIDIDGHNSGDNALANEVLSLFANTYCEISPSGTGYHILFKVDTSRLPIEVKDGKKKIDPKYYVKNPKNELECYIGGCTNRFFTFTGNMCSRSSEIVDCTDEVLYFFNKYMRKEQTTMSLDVLERARTAKNGDAFVALYDNGDIAKYNNDDSSADLALCNMLAFWLQGDEQAVDTAFRGSALYRPKWEREDYRHDTIAKAVVLCNGEFYRPVGRPRKNPTQQQAQPKDDRERFSIEHLEAELKARNIEVKFNVIANSIEVCGYDDKESAEHILATLPTILYSDLIHAYKGVTQTVISDYLLVIATRNRFNPVLDVLSQVKWDGKNHLQRVYDALGIADDDLSKTLVHKWFWQGWALLHNDPKDPIGADGVLTLAGKQGIGKTSFFRKMSLSPKFFREGQSIDNYDKDCKRRAVTTWICELGELDCTLKSDMGMLKAFITNAYDEYRLPYGRVDEQNARRTNLGATVNGTQFLIDPTGNRRFWTVPVENIDLDALNAVDAYQVWAQVWEQDAKKNIQGFRLTKAEQNALAERNNQCEKAIAGEDEVRDLFARDDVDMVLMSVSDFITNNDSLRKYSAKQISMVLDKMGIEKVRATVDGKKSSRYRMLPKVRMKYTY